MLIFYMALFVIKMASKWVPIIKSAACRIKSALGYIRIKSAGYGIFASDIIIMSAPSI